MNRFHNCYKKIVGKLLLTNLAIIKKPRLYSIIASLGILSFFGFDPAWNFTTLFFNNSITPVERTESLNEDKVEQIILRTYSTSFTTFSADFDENINPNILSISEADKELELTFLSSTIDTDGDGIYDITDLDDDNDGIPDFIEKTNCGGMTIAFFEDFGSGTYPGAALSAGITTYTYNAPTQPANYPNIVDDGEYVIANGAQEGKSDWQDIYDHTSVDSTGYMMLVNADYDPDEFYKTTVAISSSTVYDFTAWAIVVNSGSNKIFCEGLEGGGAFLLPDITFEVRGNNSGLIGSISSGEMPFSVPAEWNKYGFAFSTGSTDTSIDIVMINNAPGGCGNDLAIDDISIATLCDTDNDGIHDHLDLDSDNDGIYDLIEAGGTDSDLNGIVDNLSDQDEDGQLDLHDDDCAYVIDSTNYTGNAVDAYNIGGDSGNVSNPTNAAGAPGTSYASFTGGNQYLIIDIGATIPAGGSVTLHLGASSPWNNIGVQGSNSTGSTLGVYYGTLGVSSTGSTSYDFLAYSDLEYLRIVDYTGNLRVFGLSYSYTSYNYGDCTGSSLSVPNSGNNIYPDYVDIDSDGDGCFDTAEEGISDTDSDGYAGTGVPTVNADGLVTTIIYAAPPNDIWRNPLIGPCLAEVCNDGLDNDTDGDTDCADSDCAPSVSLTLPDVEECVSSSTLTLGGGSPSGGTYSGTGVSGTNFNASTAGTGTHTITYTYTDSNGCSNSTTDDITVLSPPTVSLTLGDNNECDISTTLSLSGGLPSGGSYSGTGVSGTNFNASSVGAGTYTITYTYTDGNGCSNTATDDITVHAPPTTSLTLTNDEDCISNNALVLAGDSPSGGSYSGTGVSGTNFDASTAGAGTHTITYTYTDGNGCTNTATDDLTVFNLSAVSLNLPDSVECETNTTLTLSNGLPSGGTYSGTGVSGGNFDATVAGVGVHVITYTYTDGNGCDGIAMDNIQVIELPEVHLTLTDDEDCISNTILSLGGGTPIGGTYSGTGVSGGNFNASVAGLGTHPITYTYTDVNGCTSTEVDNMTVVNPSTVSLTLTNDSDCVSGTSLALGGGSPSGGTYSGPGVSGTNFDASVAGAGIHVITYTVIDGNGCSNLATDNIVVFDLPAVSFTLTDAEDCVLNNTLALSGGLPSGGTYSGTGVSGTNFDATVAGLGTHTITYTYTDGNGCVNTSTDDIDVVPATTVTLSLGTDEDCALNNSLTLSGGLPLGGIYSGTGVTGGNFNASGVGAGTYNIFYTYTDANSCSNTAVDVITVHAAPSVSAIAPTNPLGCGSTNGMIEVTGTGGTGSYEFRLNSGAWQTSNTFTGLSAGSYNVYIRNDNDFCEVAYVSNPVLLADPSSPTAEINVPTAGCINVANSFTATNAGLGATYSWNFGAGASPATATGIGPHSVTYSNAGSKNVNLSVTLAGCVAGDSENFTVNALPTVGLILTDTEACVSSTVLVLNDGTPIGGVYSGVGVSGTNFNAATAGVGTHTITYTYTDANGCINSATDNIEVLALPTVGLTLGADEACVSETTLVLSGGSPSGGVYSGSGVSGTNFNPSVSGAGTHTITYTYTDGNNCVNTATDIITVYDFPTINLVSPGNPTTCSGTNGTIVITASGATGNFEYRLDSGTWQSSNTFTGLGAGSYNVSIRNANDFCELVYVSNPVVLTDPPATTVTTTVTSDYTGEDISCVGEADGTASASGNGGLGPYSYVWSNGQTGAILSNVAAGTYTVTATDANGCQGTETVTLNDPPPLSVTATFTNVSCYGGLNGAIDVTATGGVGSYTYAWSDIAPDAFYLMDGVTSDISGNNYDAVSIIGAEAYSTDAHEGSHSFDFNGSTSIQYNDNPFLESSFAYMTMTMWIKPDDLDDVQNLFEIGGRRNGIGLRLDSDNLQGSVRESNNERTAFEINLPNDGQWHQVGFVYDNGKFTLILDGVMGSMNNTGLNTISLPSEPHKESGAGGKIGEDVFGGDTSADPYYYSGLMDNVSIQFEALTASEIAIGEAFDEEDRTGLSGGDYTVLVYDLNGCIDSITLTLTQPDSLALTANVTDALCNGQSNGIINLNVAGGTAPFSYTWSNGATTEDISNLGAGTFDVTVSDANSCTVEGSYVVNEPPVFSATATVTSDFNGYDVTCPGATNGNGNVSLNGGTGPFSYAWSNGQTNANLINVGAGTYTVTVTDTNGCTTTDAVTFSDPPGISVVAAVTSSYDGEDISCVGASDGIARATASNGASPYTYVWSNGQTTDNLINVSAGSYTVTATDANGCSNSTSVTLNDPPAIDLTTLVTSDYNGADVSCAGATDGSATAFASGGSAPFTYAWSNGQNGTSITLVGAGIYTVTVTDAFGCTDTETVTITNPLSVNVSVSITSDFNGSELSCIGSTDGAATATPSGGVGTYTYAWSNGETTANIANLGAGTYTVTASDENGCTAETSVSFAEPPALNLSLNASPPSDCGVDDGIILMTASGGVGTYEYSLDNVTYQSSNAFTGLTAGTYFAYVRNTFGTCVVGPQAILVNVPEAPTIDNVTIINPITNVSTDGGVLITASGSGLALEYSIDGTNWQSSNLFDLLSEGVYTIQVRYVGFNCIASYTATLVAGGGVVGGGGGTSYCSNDLSGVSFVEEYYIPFQEDHIFTALNTIWAPSCDPSGPDVNDPIQTYISIGVVEDGTLITYDHWEDGFEPNLSFPIQSTTEVWGDGDASNGMPPGYTVDYLNAADIIVLNNGIASSTRAAVIDFDGGDKIGSRGNLALTRLGWASGTTVFLAGALEVYPTTGWGTDYDIPVGPNTNVHDLFEYTGAIIMAKDDNTTVNIDADGNNTFESSIILNEGESHLINAGLSSGGQITTSRPVQVHLITGDICQTYESRWFTLKPTDQWSDSYFNPVATPNDGSNTHVDFTNAPTYVHLYNPNTSLIQVRWETTAGYQGQVSVAAGGTNYIELPDNTGTHFYTNNGRNFYAIATIDSDEFGNNARNDWGYALTPESALSSQITLVGFAPGANPLITTSENSAPVWLTADYPTGSSSTGAITICVDYNGDGGALSDANGISYDATVVLNPLANTKLYDSDGDQTGMRIWVCDGSDALIAGAWGQDPVNVTTESDAIDLGVGLPNGIPFAASKCVELSKDYNSNGLYDECDEVIYTLQIRNTGVLPLSTGAIEIIDTLPGGVTYIDNSTVSIVNGVVNNISDGGTSPFPLDESGFNYNAVIQPGDSIIIRFEVSINDLPTSTFIRNLAYISNGQQELLPEVSFPTEEPTGAILAGIPADVTVACGNIPDPPNIGSDIYTINNCEEMDTIAQGLWALHYVDSEELSVGSNQATNAFDDNPNTIWHTEYNLSSPAHPHEIQIDLGASYNITGFRYLPRQNNSDGLIGDFEFYVSSDGTTWGAAETTGTWTFGTSEIEETFNTINGRYVRLVALSEVNGNPWTSIAELDVLQCINYAPETIVYTQDSTQTNNGSSTDDCYDITRTWEVTDYCGQVSTFVQNITVEDTENPVLVDVPADITVTSATIPEPPVLNCSSPGNLALAKPSSQSSTSGSAVAANGVDGDYSNSSIIETNNEFQPWWEVDLQNIHPIEEIEIWNRTDCCAARLSNYYVLISDEPFASTDLSTTLLDPSVIALFQSAIGGTPSTISVDATGRYIRIQLQATDQLHLAEVVVRPPCISATDNCDTDVSINYTEINIPAGCTYDITRTWEATDNCGNSISQSQTITVASILETSMAVTSNFNGQDLSCSTTSDGTATVTVSGGIAPLIINWSNGQTVTEATNLGAGVHYVTVTDGNGCQTEDSITLTAPPVINLNVNITSDYNGEDISCFGANDGSAFANANGGTGTISYLWSNGANSGSATTLSSGTYTVTATDANGCTVTASVTLDDPPQLTVNATITSDYNGANISCPGLNDGEASASSTGGVGTIVYNWSNSQTGTVNTNLIAGVYRVTATDDNGCIAIDSVTLVDPVIITASISLTTNPTLCEATDGSFTVAASGGMGTYQYRIGLAGIWQGSNTFLGLSSGTYDVYVRNSDGTCTIGPTSVMLDDPIPQSCPIIPAIDTLTYCNTDISVILSVAVSPDGSGYTWTIPTGMNVVSGTGTNTIELDMNEIAIGSYDICMVTNSNCGDSPPCCITLEIVTCSEICNNGIDDDGDGDTDLADSECVDCGQIYSSDLNFLQSANLGTGLLTDPLNAVALLNDGDAIGLDPLSLRFYYLDAGNVNPVISYLDPGTSSHINTGVSISAGATLPGLGFNAAGLGYAISNSGGLYRITTNYGGTDIPAVALLGNIGAATVGDLAVDNDGIIWAIFNTNELYKIDPNVAIPTSKLIGTLVETSNFGGNSIESVAFSGTGELLVGAGSQIYNVNISTAQATLIGNLGVATHDFASCAFPTFTTDLAVTKTVAQTGPAAPGDTLDYTITVANTGNIIVTGATLTDTIPEGTNYVAGSTTVNGNSVTDASGEMPFVNGSEINSDTYSSGSILSGSDVVITFRAVIDCCPGIATISNQGAVDFDGAAALVLSDDPALPGTADPTDIAVSTLAAPIITTAASNLTIDCNSSTNATDLTNWLNANGGATASVACGTVNWSNDYTSLSDLCGGTGTATVIFTATNDCGLSINTTAAFTIIDTIAPVWTLDPSGITIECNGTADPRGEISAWLAINGGGLATDQCGIVNITHDYTTLTTTGCSGTGSATVTFTAEDECGLTTTRSAVLTIVDTTAPELTSLSDITVDCDSIPVPVAPVATDSCDTAVDIVYQEVTVYHPRADWKSSGTCELLHTVSGGVYDDKGTTGDTSDDEMTFTITVIGQNTGTGWSANVNGTTISGEYYKTYEFGPMLSNGSVLNFSIVDDVDGACNLPVIIDAVNF